MHFMNFISVFFSESHYSLDANIPSFAHSWKKNKRLFGQDHEHISPTIFITKQTMAGMISTYVYTPSVRKYMSEKWMYPDIF